MTDSYVELLLGEQDNVNAAIIEVLQSPLSADTLVVLLEGDDDGKFYFDAIKEFQSDAEILLIDCRNKDNVVRAASFFEGYRFGAQPRGILAICDKDFDEFIGKTTPDFVFKTDLYSIENYILDEGVLTYLCEKFSDRRENYKDVRRLVVDFRREFIVWSVELRSVFACMAHARAQAEDVEFDDLSVADLLDFTSGKLARRSDLMAAISEKFKCKNPASSRDLAKYSRQFTTKNVDRWVRGKHALQIAKKIAERAFLTRKVAAVLALKYADISLRVGYEILVI